MCFFDVIGRCRRIHHITSRIHLCSQSLDRTAFTACIQTHGNVTRPYDFDEQTIDIYRAYTKLHELLVPYIRDILLEA